MIGSQIGSYKILDKLGEGGMGVVYKAVDTSLDRIVAIKALSAALAHNPDLEKLFRAEAKAQAYLNHTNIAMLFALLFEDGQAWMVMEYVEGESLAGIIARRGLLPWQEAVPIFKQALLGVGYAHRMGICHRDIKPSNIMLNTAGVVKVMDFGIAKVMGERGVTNTGPRMGTAAYMSPEQVVDSEVDSRSDIYSLGITFYEMLTANLPFNGQTDFEVMQAHVQTPPPAPTLHYPHIPNGIENAVLQALEKNPAARFQTVDEFGAALEHPETYPVPAAETTRVEAHTRTAPPLPPPGPPASLFTLQPVPPTARPGLLAGRDTKLAAGGCAIAVLALAALDAPGAAYFGAGVVMLIVVLFFMLRTPTATVVAPPQSTPIPPPPPDSRHYFGSVQVTSGSSTGPRFPITREGLIIGRDPVKCQLVLHGDTISKEHAWIVPIQAGVVVIDRGSANGTYLNSTDAPRVSKVVLQNGDRIFIGKQGAGVLTYFSS